MSSQPPKILLLGAGFTTQNMGVWALASGAISSVLHTHPNAKIYVLDYNEESSIYKIQHAGGVALVKLINIRFSKKFWRENNIVRLLTTALLIKLFPVKTIKNWIIARDPCLQAIESSAITGSIAGGDSFSDIYGIERLIYVTLPQLLVILMDRPLVLLPQTLGPFKSAVAKVIARYILKHSRKIYSRDMEGLSLTRKLIRQGEKKVTFCYDMGFALEPRIKKKRMPKWLAEHNRSRTLIGLNVSGLLYIGGYRQNNMFGLKLDYQKLILDLIDYFIRKNDTDIMLVPHVFGSGENSESDVLACRKVHHKFDESLRHHVHLVGGGYDHHEIKAVIGQCDFFLGSRMHACIAALSQCIPAVGLAYSRKFRGVFSSIGVQGLVADLREYDRESITMLVDQIYQQRLELRAKLEAKIPAVKSSVLSLFKQYAGTV